MRLGKLLLVPVLTTLALLAPTPVDAAEPAPTTLTVTAEPVKQFAGEQVTLGVDLVDDAEMPIVGAVVHLDGKPDQAAVTDALGHAQLTVTEKRKKRKNHWVVVYDGDESHAASRDGVRVPIKRRTSHVSLRGPDSVVDEQRVSLTVRWRTGNGMPVPGRVVLKRRTAKTDWKKFDTVRTGSDGEATFRVRPRRDTKYRAVVHRLSWVTADRSKAHLVDNLPPGTPVKLPKAAPKPRINLPKQAHAKGDGAHPHVSRIPSWMWKQMTGRTWHKGCPVGRAGLRVLRINYWDYHGYRRRGELVAAAHAVDNMRDALVEMYQRKLPLRSLYREDRFGWSKRLRGANDYKSMAAGNSSAFNCRGVVGNPGARSPHSYGTAFDVNTWENPYRSAQGTVPNTWWQGHSHPRVAWRSSSHTVVEVMARHGLRWTYGTGDTQHFDVRSSGRARMTTTDEYVDCNGVCD